MAIENISVQPHSRPTFPKIPALDAFIYPTDFPCVQSGYPQEINETRRFECHYLFVVKEFPMPKAMPTTHEPKVTAFAATQSKSSELMNVLAWFCAGMALSSVIITIIN